MYVHLMRASRLISLLLLLQTRGQLTATELAERFEVSVRTIHRDVESLGAAGVPVEAVRGPAGGYRLAGGYRTRLTGLTSDEAEALFVGPAAELGLGRVLAEARLKLLSALPAELQERAERSARLFHLDTRGWFRGEDRTPHLPALASAAWEGRRVDARYREGRRVVRRTLDPLGLVFKAGAWYLVARRRGELRVYRVSRFASVRPREERFERPAGFELAGYWSEWSRSFETSRPRIEVRVRLDDPALVRYLPRERRVERDAVVASFESLDEAYRELLRFGTELEVLDPPELRERVGATAAAVADLYGVRRIR
jgi:predicted DNA-binding transcriptional regulator YafY